MVDTVRTISELLAIFANNTSGDITPQDMRDFVVTVEAFAPSIPVSRSVVDTSVGTYYMLGQYDCPAADSNLTDASPTQAHGTANSSHATHAIAIASGNGSTDGTGLVLTVSGTSITDAGVRTPADSEVIVADCTTAGTDQYFETSKKWIGTVVYTLTSGGGATTFDFTFNYGFAGYHDAGNSNFDVTGLEFEWFGSANDSGFEIEILHHKSSGWTYSAAAFVPGATPIYTLTGDHSTESNIVSGEYGRWKRSGLSDAVAGAGSEGILIRFDIGTNNAVDWMNGTVSLLPTA